MTKSFAVSIVTCIRDQNIQLFEACARSVTQQSGKNEWIVIDDGSSPSNAAANRRIVRECGGRDLATTYIARRESAGLSVSRNFGLRRCRGEWVVILDSDDELHPELCDLLRHLDKRIGLACFRAEYLKADGSVEVRSTSPWNELFQIHGGTSLDPFLWFDFYYHGMIARREIFTSIGGYDETLPVGEDQDILLKAGEMLMVDQVAFVDRTGYRYRENLAGVCATRWSEVEQNYTKTMVAASNRRGASYSACRLVGAQNFNHALVDEYEYFDNKYWVRWAEAINDLR
jgi:glycosyltransferase involved in cell wall biosynthesis